MRTLIGKFLYAFFFCAALPALLLAWAGRLDSVVRTGVPDIPLLAGILLCSGALLLLLGMADLLRFGKGLPMNAYPPEKFAARGVYGLLGHPIYIGFVLLCAGYFVHTRSSGGLWVVTPAVALGVFALLYGYELPYLDKTFGADREKPLLSLPPDSPEPASFRDRAPIFVLLFLPWGLLYLAFEFIGPFRGAVDIRSGFERGLPVLEWTEAVYASVYLFLALTPFLLRKKSELREFLLGGWVLCALGFFAFLTVPFIAQAREFEPRTFWGALIMLERRGDSPATAFPAFHFAWPVLAAFCVGKSRGWKLPLWLYTAAAGASCVTTGPHAIADVAAGGLLGWITIKRGSVWRALLRFSELVAGSWGEVRFGSFRIINHGFWVALGAGLGIALAAGAMGPEHKAAVFGTALAALLGAGIWGQALEGSSVLARPFGYYGGLIGGLAGITALGNYYGNFWALAAAFALAAPWIQLFGRLRCLVQGCCHGAPCPAEYGIRYYHPLSRVLRIAGMKGVPVHPTQLYSMVGNFFIGLLLLRFWSLELPASFIGGAYLVLGSAQRFAEEQYRGEPQTREFGGLKIYQWLCIFFFALGATLTACPAPVLPFFFRLDAAAASLSLLTAATVWFAMGCDWPESNKRFSRLT